MDQNIQLLIIGPEGAGKTEIAHILCSKKRTKFRHTVNGTAYEAFIFNKTITITETVDPTYELEKIHGVICVVDSREYNMNRARTFLTSFISQKRFQDIPLIVAGTYQDDKNALTTYEFCEEYVSHFNLSRQRPCLVVYLGKNNDYPIFKNEVDRMIFWMLEKITGHQLQNDESNEGTTEKHEIKVATLKAHPTSSKQMFVKSTNIHYSLFNNNNNMDIATLPNRNTEYDQKSEIVEAPDASYKFYNDQLLCTNLDDGTYATLVVFNPNNSQVDVPDNSQIRGNNDDEDMDTGSNKENII